MCAGVAFPVQRLEGEWGWRCKAACISPFRRAVLLADNRKAAGRLEKVAIIDNDGMRQRR